jgi:hypothetical protein
MRVAAAHSDFIVFAKRGRSIQTRRLTTRIGGTTGEPRRTSAHGADLGQRPLLQTATPKAKVGPRKGDATLRTWEALLLRLQDTHSGQCAPKCGIVNATTTSCELSGRTFGANKFAGKELVTQVSGKWKRIALAAHDHTSARTTPISLTP